MVTPAEKDTSGEPSSIEEVKVIAIKLPFDLQERLMAFPFLHALREHYKKAEIHFITPKFQIEVLNLLPFKAYYHEYEEEEFETVFDVHRYAATSKIFNVDIFISLTNSFVDACLGLGLRAKKRVGFSDGWKTLVLTHKTPRPRGHHLSEDFFALYRELVQANFDMKLKVMSRELEPVIADWEANSYVAINLSPLRDGVIDGDLADLINHFENQKIVLFASEDQALIEPILDPFLATLSKKNFYQSFTSSSWIEIAKMLAFSRGCLTYNGPAASVAAYVGTKTLVLYNSEDPQRTGPFPFLSDLLILGTNDPSLINSTPSQSVFQEKKRFQMVEVYGRAFEFFRLAEK